ncbi:MAG: DHHA1 domain-containing protein [Dissulfurispiraceae bacterium]|nr:DHHA1 domain-containing protein [Dissulfurispiraceae bacterium]
MPVPAAKKWLVSRTNQDYVSYVSRMASVSQTLAQVMISRGLRTPSDIESFLDPSLARLSDPFCLPGMRAAVDRINKAKKSSELVFIHGDYDADGVTATAILVETLDQLGIKTVYFIPDRIGHGYGFTASGLNAAKNIGASLIITVDCGISSIDTVMEASKMGIDVIITDHHEPVRMPMIQSAANDSSVSDSMLSPEAKFILPEALAIINPKVTDSPLSILSGAGIAFKIAQALLNDSPELWENLVDLAAIGTAADSVPLVGDNRIIVKKGLELVKEGRRAGIQALKNVAGGRSEYMRSSFLSFVIIPRINAAGRISNASDVVKLLVTKDETEAASLAVCLNELNSKRQRIEEQVYNEALAMLENIEKKGVIVLASEQWHPGVVGIVASRLTEKFNLPSFVLSVVDGTAKGSGRSIPGFDLHHSLSMCSSMLTRFGGHKMAAGLSLDSAYIDSFRMMLSEIAINTLKEDDFIPQMSIDAAVSLNDISVTLVDELARLEPFGYGNEEPLFGAKSLDVLQARVVGSNHLKLYLKQNGRSMDSIGFDMGEMLDFVEDAKSIDAVFVPAINEWNGARYLQLNLKALRSAS